MIGYQLMKPYSCGIIYRNIIIMPIKDSNPRFIDSRSDGKQRSQGYCNYFALQNPANISDQITGYVAPGKPFISYNKTIYEERFASDII